MAQFSKSTPCQEEKVPFVDFWPETDYRDTVVDRDLWITMNHLIIQYFTHSLPLQGSDVFVAFPKHV